MIESVDYVLLAGQRSPGLCDFEGVDSQRRWDERRGYGLTGSTVVFRGVSLCHFVLKLRLYTAADWAAWDEWKPLVAKPPPPDPRSARPLRAPRALDISHPLLDEVGIRAVVVENLKAPVQTADGEWTIEIALIEFRRPVYALSPPVAGSADRPTALTENQRTILLESGGLAADQAQEAFERAQAYARERDPR